MEEKDIQSLPDPQTTVLLPKGNQHSQVGVYPTGSSLSVLTKCVWACRAASSSFTPHTFDITEGDSLHALELPCILPVTSLAIIHLIIPFGWTLKPSPVISVITNKLPKNGNLFSGVISPAPRGEEGSANVG